MEKKELLEEIQRCVKDPVYFICNHIKVIHPVRGLVKFNLYGFQKRILTNWQDSRFTILRKFRQAGCTTLASAFSLWFTIFKKHKTIAILSKGEREATEILERIQTMYDELPAYFKIGLKEHNKHTIKFKNGSAIRSRSSGPQAGRSISGSLLILDEAAFIENIDTIYTAAYPIISTGGSVIALSTVNGMGNWFHRMYTEAKENLNNFHAIDINWKEHPEYYRHKGYEHLYEEMAKRTPPVDIDKWEEITRSNITPREWYQEYACEFLGTGDTYIDGEVLRQLQDDAKEPISRKYSGRFYCWENPHPYYEYLISVDPALGRHKDYSSFHVINLYNGNQVGEFYSNNTPVNEFCRIISEVGCRYNQAYVTVERNTIGNHVLDLLINRYEYEGVISDENNEPGIQVTLKNRELYLSLMEEFIRLRKFKLNSQRTLNELNTFIINDNGKPEADENCNDDLVMSLAIAAHSIKNLLGGTPMEFEKFNNDLVINDPIKKNTYSEHGNRNHISEEDYKWLMSN
jgi:hypothetical protein